MLPKIIIFPLLFILFGCGPDFKFPDWRDWRDKDIGPEYTIPDKNYDDDLDGYLEDFVADAESYGVDLPHLSKLRKIEWGETRDEENPRRVGVCYSYSNRSGVIYTEIVISNEFKNNGSITLRALMYHEFGHCILGLPHELGRTIMAPALHSRYYYKRCWEPLVEQLFLGGEVDCD